MVTVKEKAYLKLAAVIERTRRTDPAVLVAGASARERQKLLAALVDGWGVEDTLKRLSQATVVLAAGRRRMLARNERALARTANEASGK